MGKLGYSSMTLTDLTETIPVTLLLEVNQNNNIQTKAGDLYTPDFSKKDENNNYVEELIITPSLFLGKEEIDLNRHPEFVIPGERTSGFIYYVLNYQDSEHQYFYNADEQQSIFVDEVGALHIRENLSGNLTIEAFLEDFYNEQHNYEIPMIQANNPINFLLLEDNQNSYTVVVYSRDGRQHFENANENAIILEASLYRGLEIIFSTDPEENIQNNDFECEWYQLTNSSANPSQRNNSFEISRDNVYSEEKVLCRIKNKKTNLEYSGSIDIWDMKEDYDCVIIADSLTFNESIEKINFLANVYDSQGSLLTDFTNVSYEWSWMYTSSKDLQLTVLEGKTEQLLELALDSFDKTFLIGCKIFINGKFVASEFETIQFVPEFNVKVNPENIFINTSSDGEYLGKTGENSDYIFEFSLLDKNGSLLKYNNSIDEIGNSTTSEHNIQINFTPEEEGFWKFKGSIKASDLQEIWNKDFSSLYLDFDYKHYNQLYSAGLTLVKNIIGKDGSSAYNIVILSSSGSTLTYGDSSTTLSAQVYLGGQLMDSESYDFQWRKDGEPITDANEDNYTVKVSSFSKKAIYDCIVSADEKTIGSASYTLIDDTDSLPISLILDSNLESHIQLKEKETYLPDFTQKEVKITPILFIGNTSVSIPKKLDGTTKTNTIYYQINGTEYYPTENTSGKKIYVDNKGVLHIKENLTQNTTILALIRDFEEDNHNIQKDLIQSISPINILFLDETNTNIYALVESEREYFDDQNTSGFQLSAKLYKNGKEENISNLSYKWSSLKDSNRGTSSFIDISRNEVQGRNLYTCEITDNSTGFSYTASKIIQDFTDEYECRIIYDKPLLLNNQNSEINLSASLWNKNLNQEVTTGNQAFSWFIMTESSSDKTPFSSDKECSINLENSLIPQNSSFTVICEASENNKILAMNLVTFHYAPSYSVRLTQQNFYVPMDKNNDISQDQTFNFTFQLIGSNGTPLSMGGKDVAPSFEAENEAGLSLDFSDSSDSSGLWDFTGTIEIDSDYVWSSPADSLVYEFTYVYLGQTFTEEINIIKNIAGTDGASGISPINVIMLSSSGSILTYGDTGTDLSVQVYRGDEKLNSESLTYNWYKDGQPIDTPTINPEILSAAIEDFGNKATYTCEVYDNANKKLGEASYVLIDHTDDVPITLTLKSNKNQNIQVKTGNKIEPNFEDSPLIIEPLLYVNNVQKQPYTITYKVNGNDYFYPENKNSSNATIYVEEDGILYIKENLLQNFTITATATASEELSSRTIQSLNSIDFLFLEEGMDSYHLVIASGNSRTFFDDSNMGDITLTPTLYKGNSPTSESVSYKWDNLSENSYGENGDSITIPRTSVVGRDLYTCTATVAGTGLSYTASVVIQDFTDQYECRLVYDKPLLLNSSNPVVTITASTWDKNKGANGKVTSIGTDKITYAWEILSEGSDKETSLTGGTNGTYQVSITDANIPKNKNFTIVCHSKVIYEEGERLLATNTVTFQYVPEYSVKISPQNIFVLTDSSGKVLSTSKTHTFNFKLVDKSGEPLSYTSSSFEVMPNFTGSTNNEVNITFSQTTAGKWDFTGKIDLTNNFKWENFGSKTYEFNYTYFGQQFSEEVNLIKNQKGADGAAGDSVQGISAYSVDFTNEFHVFKGGESIATPGQTATCEIQGFYGDESCEIEKITANDTTKNLATNNASVTINNLTITSVVQSSKKVKLTFTTGSGGNFVTSPGSIAFTITIKNPETTATKTFLKTFSYTINYLGESYYLELSNNTIKYSEVEGFEVNQVSVSALTRTNNGAPNTYDGKIIYAYEYSDSSSTWKTCSGSISLVGQKDLRNIQIRLYSSKAGSGEINADWLKNNSQYLLDKETIPILHSLDGYEFGGENLLRWTKTLPIETNKWVKGSNATSAISIAQEGDFSVASFSSSAVSGKEYTYYSLSSPKIKLTEDLIGKEFCLSCYFYCDDYNSLTSKDYSLFVLAAGKEFSADRNRFGTVGTVHATEAASKMKFLDAPQNGKWCRIYTTFKIDENVLSKGQTPATKDENGNYINGDYIDSDGDGSYDSGEEILVQVEECNYFWIQFYSVNTCSFKIKQPMLVQGNTFSAWSASPYDVSYDEIRNINMGIVPGLNQEISAKAPYLHFADLSPDTTYTFSFQSSAWLGRSSITKFYCYLYERDPEDTEDTEGSEESEASYTEISFNFSNNSQTKKIKTFTTPSAQKIYSFRIYAIDNTTSPASAAESDILVLEKIKLEKGNQATSFFLTDEQLQEIIDNTKADTLKYTNELGQEINLSLSEAKTAISSLQDTQLTIDAVKGEISTATSAFYKDEDDFIKRIRGKIEINSANASKPYIQISTEDSTASFSIKITDQRLSFYEGQGNDLDEVAYISGKQLEINSARFNKNFYIGDLLVTVTDTGVGFTW